MPIYRNVWLEALLQELHCLPKFNMPTPWSTGRYDIYQYEKFRFLTLFSY